MAVSISILTGLAKLHISALRLFSVIVLILFCSSFDVIAEPASITSTPSSSSLNAIFSFSLDVISTPGVCSPSLSVVSNILRFSNISYSLPFFANTFIILVKLLCIRIACCSNSFSGVFSTTSFMSI